MLMVAWMLLLSFGYRNITKSMNRIYDPNGHDYRQHKANIVKSVTDNLHKYDPKQDPLGELMDKTKQLTLEVLREIHPILVAGGGHDLNALRQHLALSYVEKFSKFSKDEMVQVLTILHTEIAMNQIATDPSGSGKPDLLSGV